MNDSGRDEYKESMRRLANHNDDQAELIKRLKKERAILLFEPEYRMCRRFVDAIKEVAND